MKLEPIEYNGRVIWVDNNIKQADEGRMSLSELMKDILLSL
jgi:hypothetical protein